MTRAFFYRWGPAILLMAAIFGFSSTPASRLPSFGSVDYFIKKGGHMMGYALLALAYKHGFQQLKNSSRWSLVLAVLYALTDEFHQSFVPGRHPSLLDVLLFDATGAAIALWLSHRLSAESPD
jgi:VanZ family protein